MLECVCVCVCLVANSVDMVHLALATCKPSTEISLFSLDGLQNTRGRGAENMVGGMVLVGGDSVCVCARARACVRVWSLTKKSSGDRHHVHYV